MPKIESHDVPSTDKISVAPLRLHLNEGEAFWDNHALELPHLSFRLLYMLAERSPSIVSQKDLIDFVWEGVAVSDDALKQRVSLLRENLQKFAGHQSPIETVRGQGYRFKALHFSPENTSTGPLITSKKKWLVLAFTSLFLLVSAAFFYFLSSPVSGPTRVVIFPPETAALTASDNWWVKAIEQEVQKQLISIQGFVPVDGAGENTHSPTMAAAIELKSSYIRTDNRLHVGYQLIDVANRTILWSHSFESTDTKKHSNPANVAGYISVALHNRFAGGNENGVPITSIVPAEAYDLYLAGLQFIFKPTAAENAFAQEHFTNALELYSDFDLARAALAITQADQVLFYSGTPIEAEQSLRNATAVRNNQPQLAEAQYAYGLACLANGQIEEGVAALDKAVLQLPYLNRKVRGYRKRFGSE